MKWFIEHWPKATIFTAIYLFIPLVCFVAPDNFPLFLIWLQTVVYFLHEFEEYVCPGGFLEFFNKKILGSDQAEFPMTKTDTFWINIPLIFVAFPVSALLATYVNLSLGLWTAYFSMINALAHIVWIVKFKYNPGVVVGLLVNVPVGIFTVYYFISHNILPISTHIISFVFAAVVQIVMMYFGFAILKPKNNKTKNN